MTLATRKLANPKKPMRAAPKMPCHPWSRNARMATPIKKRPTTTIKAAASVLMPLTIAARLTFRRRRGTAVTAHRTACQRADVMTASYSTTGALQRTLP